MIYTKEDKFNAIIDNPQSWQTVVQNLSFFLLKQSQLSVTSRILLLTLILNSLCKLLITNYLHFKFGAFL